MSTMEGASQLGTAKIDANDFEDRLFAHLADGDNTVSFGKFKKELEKRGLRPSDPRLAMCMGLFSEKENTPLDMKTFKECIKPNIVLINKTFRDELVISDFEDFTKIIDKLHERSKPNNSGKVATYTTTLANINPDFWGVSVCTVDGQRHSVGDFRESFTLQSVSKPLTYAIVLNDRGPDEVHKYIGYEPSGHSLYEICLDRDEKPHNPMINSGAIMTCSLLKPEMRTGQKLEYVMKKFQELAGGEYLPCNVSAAEGNSDPVFNRTRGDITTPVLWSHNTELASVVLYSGNAEQIFLSEKQNADQNTAIGYHMKARKCFPDDANLENALDLYCQLCALEINCESGAVLAATLANDGVCPITDDRLLSSETVRDTLSLMFSCGMYDYSGQFAFKVGLPAKSGMSGCIILVVPKVMGVCLWSPPLDKWYNSCRGIEFCENFNELFRFHNFDIGKKTSLTRSNHLNGKYNDQSMEVVKLLFGAYNGDVTAMRRYALQGVDMDQQDYDGRTALHVAAAEGRLNVVKFLLEECEVDCTLKDRWEQSPLQEAKRFKRKEVEELLEQKME